MKNYLSVNWCHVVGAVGFQGTSLYNGGETLQAIIDWLKCQYPHLSP